MSPWSGPSSRAERREVESHQPVREGRAVGATVVPASTLLGVSLPHGLKFVVLAVAMLTLICAGLIGSARQ